MKRVWATDQLETDLRRAGRLIVAGADEVGRGAIAGPLVTAVVVLPEHWTEPVCDSKLLTYKMRAHLSDYILRGADGYGIGIVAVEEIDRLGLSEALRLGFERCLEDIDLPVSHILLDGNIDFLQDYRVTTTVIGGDRLSINIAAASIVAKHFRDELMHELALVHPEYHFEQNVGYGTAAHLEALRQHGFSPQHRRSFQVKL